MFPIRTLVQQGLTPKQVEMHECILSTVATDALVLKHQAISTHSADKKSMYCTSFISKYHIHSEQHEKIELHSEIKTRLLEG